MTLIYRQKVALNSYSSFLNQTDKKENTKFIHSLKYKFSISLVTFRINLDLIALFNYDVNHFGLHDINCIKNLL